MTRDTFINTCIRFSNCSNDDAEKVLGYYRKHKIVTFNAHDGYKIIHGGYFDKDVILRVIEQIKEYNNTTNN